MTDEFPYDDEMDGDPNEGYLLALYRIQSGADESSARVLLKYLHTQLSAGEPLDPTYLDGYLLPALERIIGSKNPSNEVAKAFGFKADRGQYKRGDTLEFAERNAVLAIEVELIYRRILAAKQCGGGQLLRGCSPEDEAFERVRESHGVSCSTVRDAYHDFRRRLEFEKLAIKELEGLLKRDITTIQP